MLGDVLLGDREKQAVAEQLQRAEEQEDEGDVLGGFLFDGDFKGLEGDPLSLVAEQLNYLDATPFNWMRQDGVMFVGLGPDHEGTDRTLWIPPVQPDEPARLLLVVRPKGTPGNWNVGHHERLAEGDLNDLLELATSYAEQHANPALAMKDRSWQHQPASDGQMKYLRRLARGELTQAQIHQLRRGEAARLITYYTARQVLERTGGWAA